MRQPCSHGTAAQAGAAAAAARDRRATSPEPRARQRSGRVVDAGGGAGGLREDGRGGVVAGRAWARRRVGARRRARRRRRSGCGRLWPRRSSGCARARAATRSRSCASPLGMVLPAIEALAIGLAADERPIVLVVDEVQSIGDARCLRSLDHAVVSLPEHVQLVLISRTVPAMRLARLRTRGRACRGRRRRSGVHGGRGAATVRGGARRLGGRGDCRSADPAHGGMGRGALSRCALAARAWRPGGGAAHVPRLAARRQRVLCRRSAGRTAS